jgi:Alr-MurF fusion protein
MTNIPDGMMRPTWLEIDLDVIRQNMHLLRQIIGQDRQLFAVVKANAYGHGATLVAPAALDGGADRLAVAAVNEAIELRQAGIQAPILLLGYVPAWQSEALLHYGLTATVYDAHVAKELSALARAQNSVITVHVKVDTGMHRLGLYPEETPDFLRLLSSLPGLSVEGLYTHFSTADESNKDFACQQLATFTTLLDRLAEEGLRPPLVHSANSAATLSLPASHLNGVRCGISLYGLHPSAETPLPDGLRPVMRWVARVAQVKELKPGDAVSYGNTYVADSHRTVAVIPVGYADGFPRSPRHWGSVLIGGHHAPILGRVCMDQTIVDVTEISAACEQVRQGDEVVLIGAQGNQSLSAEEVATRLGTINYEVVSRLMARIPRVGSNE